MNEISKAQVYLEKVNKVKQNISFYLTFSFIVLSKTKCINIIKIYFM